MSGETSTSLRSFREANEYLGDVDRLNALFNEDGYLFFRNVLEGAEDVKRDFIHVLQQQGAVLPGASEPMWTGLDNDHIDDTGLYEAPALSKLLTSAHNVELIQRILGEPVFIFRSPSIRYALPNDLAYVTPPHQDYFFIRFNDSFRTLWIPLMDIDEKVGGLVLAGGIHKRGLLEHKEQENAYSYIFKGRKQKGLTLEDLPRPWLTADYHAGDLLMFHNLMVHWALPNRSDRIRLSVDVRCQPADAPRTWQAEKSILEARRFREAAKRIATEEGASEEIFEALIIELMSRDLEPERPTIRSLISELSAEEFKLN
jgi:1-deoxypentalenic acid 11beta-hydroxylase